MEDMPMPDLSHLTEEERRQIEQVLARQKNEEAKDQQVVQNLAKEVLQIEAQVLSKHQQQPFGGLMPDPEKEGLCDICAKVKFADGIGNQCNFCHLHCCSRCGGRVPMKNGKLTWVCSLCKKKQELLKKTGEWYHGHPEKLLTKPLTSTTNIPSNQTNGPNSNGPSRTQARPGNPLVRQQSHDPNQQRQLPNQRPNQRPPPLRREQTLDPGYGNQNLTTDDEARRQDSLRRRIGSEAGGMSREGVRGRGQEGGEYGHGSTRGGRGDMRESRQTGHQNRPRGPDTQQQRLPRRPDSQGGHRTGPEHQYDTPVRRPRTQSHDPYGRQSENEDYDPRRAAHENWNAPRRNQVDSNRAQYQNPPSRHGVVQQQNSFESSEDDYISGLSDFTNDEEFAGSVHSYGSDYSVATHPTRRPVRGGRYQQQGLPRMLSQQEADYYQDPYDDPRETGNVTWQPAPDGRRLIGHMILLKNTSESRSMNSATALGLKVEGGKATSTGRVGAFVTRVKHGSVADITGRLRPGDEILEWNAIPLRNRSFDEVYDIIADSREDAEIELTVSRKLTERDPYWPRNPAQGRRYSPREAMSGGRNMDSPRGNASGGDVPCVSGRIKLSFAYLHKDASLSVTVHQAAELLARPDNSFRNAYVKLCLLPNRNEHTRRRTNICSKTNNPTWEQTFYYNPLKKSELSDLTLEVMVWDYKRYEQTNHEFVGEALIELANVALNDEPRWFYLTYPDTGLETRHTHPPGYADPDFNSFPSGEGLPPAASSASRLSDMDYVSDPDMLESDRRNGRRIGNRERDWERGQYDAGRAYPPSGLHQSTRYPPARRVESPRMGGRYQEQMDPGLASDRRRGRNPGQQLADEEYPTSRSQRNRTTSAPPTSQDPYYFDDYESPPGSRPSSMASNSTRKRQLPILPATLSTQSSNLSPHHASTSATSPRRSSINTALQDPQNPAYSDPASSSSRHAPASGRTDREKPLMQLHNATLKVPGEQEEPGTAIIHPTHHPPKLDHLLKKSSQEENIDPRGNAGGLDVPRDEDPFAATRHSRSGSRRSLRGHSLSRSSEPVDKPKYNELNIAVPDMNNRKLSESLPRLESIDKDEAASQASGLEPGALLKSTSNAEVNARPKFVYEEFEARYMEQKGDKNQKSVSKAAAILGLKKDKGRPTFTRSEEVGHQSPASVRAAMTKQMSKDSNDGSIGSSSGHSHGHSSHRSHNHLPEASHLFTFIDGLGPGQLVGRQVLASPCLGEIQLNIKYSKGRLEVEVIRAKALVPKHGSRVLPATFVKVQLMEHKRTIAKLKTTTVTKSLDPLFSQTLVFNEHADHRHLQATVWADYGGMNKKILLGVALVALDDLDLSSIVIGWYKLFNPESVSNPAARSFPTGSASNAYALPMEERQGQRSGGLKS